MGLAGAGGAAVPLSVPPPHWDVAGQRGAVPALSAWSFKINPN